MHLVEWDGSLHGYFCVTDVCLCQCVSRYCDESRCHRDCVVAVSGCCELSTVSEHGKSKERVVGV